MDESAALPDTTGGLALAMAAAATSSPAPDPFEVRLVVEPASRAEGETGASGEDWGWGALRISPDAGVRWAGPGGREWAAAFHRIVLHAMCTDLDAFPELCMYCQVMSEDYAGEDDEAGGMEEVRLVPRDAAALRALFDEMSRCAAQAPRAPWERDDVAEDEDERETGGRAVAVLAHLDAVLDASAVEGDAEAEAETEGQFDDAEE